MNEHLTKYEVLPKVLSLVRILDCRIIWNHLLFVAVVRIALIFASGRPLILPAIFSLCLSNKE